MNKLAWILQNLPREGRRLDGGLALQLRRGREIDWFEAISDI